MSPKLLIIVRGLALNPTQARTVQEHALVHGDTSAAALALNFKGENERKSVCPMGAKDRMKQPPPMKGVLIGGRKTTSVSEYAREGGDLI